MLYVLYSVCLQGSKLAKRKFIEKNRRTNLQYCMYLFFKKEKLHISGSVQFKPVFKSQLNFLNKN